MPWFSVATTQALIRIHARTAEQARREVLALELCPDSAVLSVKPTRAASLSLWDSGGRYWRFIGERCEFRTLREARQWAADYYGMPYGETRARWIEHGA